MSLTPEQIEIIRQFNELPMVRERWEEWKRGDKAIVPVNGNLYVYTMDDEDTDIYDGMTLWIPLFDDPNNPERGLWGMLDKLKAVITGTARGFSVIASPSGEDIIDHDASPTIAMMKAIIWQEEHK